MTFQANMIFVYWPANTA